MSERINSFLTEVASSQFRFRSLAVRPTTFIWRGRERAIAEFMTLCFSIRRVINFIPWVTYLAMLQGEIFSDGSGGSLAILLALSSHLLGRT